MAAACPLCEGEGGRLVLRAGRLRVIHADEAGFPGFYRLVWNDHVAEFSDLPAADRAHCMEAVAVIEQSMREHLRPAKINLAALGNMVPHLHWHVVARFDWDSHFPQAIWGPRQRAVEPPAVARLAVPLAELDRRVAAAVRTSAGAG